MRTISPFQHQTGWSSPETYKLMSLSPLMHDVILLEDVGYNANMYQAAVLLYF